MELLRDDRLAGGFVRRVSAAPVDWSAFILSDPEEEQHGAQREVDERADQKNPSRHDPHSPPTHADAPAAQQDGREAAHRSSDAAGAASAALQALSVSHVGQVEKVLNAASTDVEQLRRLSWKGLSPELRPKVWKVLLGYLPLNTSRRQHTLDMKRKQYREAVDKYWNQPPSSWSHDEGATLRQISADVPRTCPEHRLFHVPVVQESIRRALFVWALKHPASGYVQGMNDLITPFLYVFLSERLCDRGGSDEHERVAGDDGDAPARARSPLLLSATSLGKLSEADVLAAEADTFWCLTALLDTIQDYYTFSQPGIQRRVHHIEELIGLVDAPLLAHLKAQGLEFFQFSFRWLNCLLMRELPFPLTLRVWDTYISEPDGFAVFHVYVCAALLQRFSEALQKLDFSELVMFLQNLPTGEWGSREAESFLSQAFLWRSLFEDRLRRK